MILTAPFKAMTECVSMCSRLSSRRSMMTVRTPQEHQSNRDLLKYVLYGLNSTVRRQNMTSDSCWLPITDEAVEGQWLDIYSGREMEHTFWARSPNSTVRNCAIQQITMGGWASFFCIVNDLYTYCPCHFHTRPYLVLRGLCKSSNIYCQIHHNIK